MGQALRIRDVDADRHRPIARQSLLSLRLLLLVYRRPFTGEADRKVGDVSDITGDVCSL